MSVGVGGCRSADEVTGSVCAVSCTATLCARSRNAIVSARDGY